MRAIPGEQVNSEAKPAGVSRGHRYDEALKSKIIAELKNGRGCTDCARAYGVPKKTVEQWRWLHVANGLRIKKKSARRKTPTSKPAKTEAPKAALKTAKSAVFADRTLILGVLVSTPKNPGGLLGDIKSLVDRLKEEAKFSADP